MLEVDRATRTISGRAVPWDVVSLMANPKRAFHKDCLTWPEFVPLVIRHDKSLNVGRAIHLESLPDGLYATFRVRHGDPGDRALALAEIGWGLSVGLGSLDYTHVEVMWCTRGELAEISLVPEPAFP